MEPNMSWTKAFSGFWRNRVRGCHQKEHHNLWQSWARLAFLLMSAAAVAWFLVRVIPKPIRATYPCQRAAFPLATTFVIWLLGLKTGLVAWLNLKKRLGGFRPVLGAAGILCLLALTALTARTPPSNASAFLPGGSRCGRRMILRTPRWARPVAFSPGVSFGCATRTPRRGTARTGALVDGQHRGEAGRRRTDDLDQPAGADRRDQ